MMNKKSNNYHIVRPDPEITPEEILQDKAFIGVHTTERTKLESPVHFRRFTVAALIVIGITIIFLGYIYHIQLIEGKRYRALASTLHQEKFASNLPRGLIKDNEDVILASNIPTIDVLLDPNKALVDRENLRERILALIGDDEETIVALEAALDGKEQVVLKQDIKRELALDLSSQWFIERGITIRSGSRRYYQEGQAFSHLLGYTGLAQQKDLDEDPSIAITEIVGRTGIEKSFNALLRGVATPGGGRPGQSIRLTIDARLQRLLFEKMQVASSDGGPARGAAVAIDPRDGSIKALLSLPSFDPDIFARGPEIEEYSALVNDPTLPLFNRAISGQYAPGSTIKPFIAVGALEEEIIEPSFTVNVTGAISIQNIYDPSIVYTFPDWKAHGLTNLRKAIAVSSNVYFYIIGGGYQDTEGLGINRIVNWMSIFGFGALTDINLDGEADGFLPTPPWKEKTKGEPWTIGDTYHAAIGQGDMQITPLQLAQATAVIANGGTLYKPRLLDAILDEYGDVTKLLELEVGEKLPITMNSIRIVQEGMQQAVQEGSAIRLRSLPVTSAGKTGTAQVGGARNPHAWFTGYFPYENPELVLTIVIENAGGSSTAAMPIVESTLQEYFSNRE